MKRRLLILFAAAMLTSRTGNTAPAQALPLLTSARQVRELSPAEAGRGYPVRLRGVLTFHEPNWYLSFIQDESGGVYINNPDLSLRAGMEVELEGVSSTGRTLPIVTGPGGGTVRCRVVGPDTWPKPIPTVEAKLNGDTYDAQWVSIRGKATWVAALNGGVMVDLETKDHKVRLAIPGWPHTWAPPGYLRGLEVDARGVFGLRQRPGDTQPKLVLFVPSIENIQIAAESLAGLFDRPRSTLQSLYTIDPVTELRLTRVFGQVLAAWPGSGFFVALTDAPDIGGKIWVTTSAPGKLSPGDLVDVVGWEQFFDHEPVLGDAVFRVEGHSAPPLRRDVTAQEAQTNPAELGVHGLPISIEATLLEQQSSLTEDSLVVEDEGIVFLARYVRSGGARLAPLKDGTRLRLGGICIARRMPHLENLPPGFAFQLLLGAPGDVQVLSLPSWWTTQRVLWLCAAVTFLGLLAVGWAGLLRRQVARQSAVIRGQVERKAVAEERARIARELHDSLGQELVGIAMQLDLAGALLAESPKQAEQSLNTARMMVCHSQAEAKLSVAGLRAQELNNVDLATALADVLKPMKPPSGHPSLDLQIQGHPRRLEGVMEHHLLRIGQEAVSNAIRHARAANILVRLCYEDTKLVLEVRDDGCGFDANEATDLASSHFGLLGLRERANKLQGRLQIESQPGKGTLVSATVQINGNQT